MHIQMRKKSDSGDGQSMAAMTDVVFLLLIFFIVTMSTYAKTTFIDAALPKASGTGGTPLPKAVHIVVLNADNSGSGGMYALNGIRHNRQQLEEAFGRFSTIAKDMRFAIRCEPESIHGDLVYALAKANEYGFNNIAMLKTSSQ